MEQIVYNDENVSVSASRFQVPGATYALANITSVKALLIRPNRTLPIVLALVGLAVMIPGGANVGVGFALLVVAGIIIYTQRPTYAVVVGTAAGETQALQHSNWAYVQTVMTALNSAIVEASKPPSTQLVASAALMPSNITVPTRTCPFCISDIPAAATVCRYCQRESPATGTPA